GLQSAREQGGAVVAVAGVAQVAPGLVVLGLVPAGVGVVVPALRAQQEARSGPFFAGDAARLGARLGLAEVQPGEGGVADQAHPESGADDVPAVDSACLVIGHRHRLLELHLLAVVLGVADAGAAAAHRGVHAGEVDDVAVLAGVGDRGTLATGAGLGRLVLLELVGEAAAGAERGGAQRGAVDPDVDRVDNELTAMGIEVRAGGQLGQRRGAGAGVADGLVLPSLVLVLPDDGRLELDRIIDEGEVGQQAVAFEHADPVGAGEGGVLGAGLAGAAAQSAALLVLLLGRHAGLGADLLLLGGDQQVLGTEQRHRLGALIGERLILELLDVVLDPGPTAPQLLPAEVPLFDLAAQRGLEAAGSLALRQNPGAQLGAGILGETVPGVGAGGEAVEESFEVPFAVALELLEHVAEEGAGRGGGEHRGGAHGRGDAVVAGEGVEDGGEQLAAQDLLGGAVGAGGADGAGEEVEGVGVEPGGAGAAGDEGDVQGVAGLASGAAHALEVAGDGLRDGGEKHGGEVADVDAHLEGGGGDEDVRGAG